MVRNSVANVIGNRYKGWRKGKHIILDCATGSGKTYFIVKILGEWAKSCNKRILYLCNRLELKKQVIKYTRFFCTNDVIDVYTYQFLQSLENEMLEEEYEYIAFDEAHYLINEAWNFYTDIILDEIIYYLSNNTIMIFMSATGYKVFEFLREEELVEEYNVFKVCADYSYVDKLIFFDDYDYILELIDKLQDDEKLIYICSNKKRAFNLKLKLGNKAYFMCSKYDKQYESDSPIEVIEEGKLITFNRQVLITTSVLDVGIDIYDKNVKHIVTDLYEMATLQQALGRKRLVDENDRCTFYIMNRSKQALTGIFNKINYDIKIANLYLYNKEGFIDYMNNSERRHFKNPCFYDKSDSRGFIYKEFNYMYYLYLKSRYDELYVAKELGFDFMVKLILGKTIKNIEYTKVIEAKKKKTELEVYLGNMIGIRLTNEAKRNLIYEIGLKDNRGRIQKSMELLNVYLEKNDIPYVIKAKKSGSSRFWVVENSIKS